MTQPAETLSALVDQLVAIHGERGLCPTASDWRSVLSGDPHKPITILNLVKFRSSADAAGATPTGFAAYAKYSAQVSAAFARVGGTLLLFGRVTHLFPAAAAGDWDAAIVTRYPSPRAVARFWLDDELIAAHRHRSDGVERGQVIVLSALR